MTATFDGLYEHRLTLIDARKILSTALVRTWIYEYGARAKGLSDGKARRKHRKSTKVA